MPNYEVRLLRQGATWSVPVRPPAYREAHQALRKAEGELTEAAAALNHASVTTKRGAAGKAELALLVGRYKRAKERWWDAKRKLEQLGA